MFSTDPHPKILTLGPHLIFVNPVLTESFLASVSFISLSDSVDAGRYWHIYTPYTVFLLLKMVHATR